MEDRRPPGLLLEMIDGSDPADIRCVNVFGRVSP